MQTGSPKDVYRALEGNIIADYDWIGGDMTHEELKVLAGLLREVLVINPTTYGEKSCRRSGGRLLAFVWHDVRRFGLRFSD